MRLPGLATACLLATACSASLEVPQGARLRCGSDDDCPQDLICPVELPPPQRVCVRAGGERPVVDRIVVQDEEGKPRTRFAPGEVVRLQVQTRPALAEAPDLVLRLRTEDRPVELKEALSDWQFVYQARVAAGDPEGPVTVALAMRSAANTPGSASLPDLFVIDATPPAVASFGLEQIPYVGPGDFVGRAISPTRARVYTRIELRVLYDEPLESAEPFEPPPLVVQARSGEMVLDFDIIERRNPLFIASTTIRVEQVDALAALGPAARFAVRATAVDEAGNLDTVTDLAVFEVDVIPPVVHRDRVLQLRRPWKSEAWPNAFPLTPAHELRGTAVANETSQTDAEGRSLHTVQLFAFNGTSGTYIGNSPLDENGNIGLDRTGGTPFELIADASRLSVVAVDAAGNQSQPVWIAKSEWIASFNAELGTPPNPNRLYRVGKSTVEPVPALASPAAPEQVAAVVRDTGESLAAAKLSIAGARQWRPHLRLDLPHRGAGMVWRPGGLVAYGGVTPAGPSDAMFTFQAGEWRAVEPTGLTPGPRVGAALVYDPARDRVVLFGGSPGDPFDARDDIWEWDTVHWFDLTPPAAGRSALYPMRRLAAAATYDSLRERVLIYGGTPGGNPQASLGDLWAWDGTAWTQLFSAGAGPEPRHGAVLVYDWASDAVVLFGGFRDAILPGCPAGTVSWPVSGTTYVACAFNDTWRFDLARLSWSRVATAASPPHRFDAVMTADADGLRLFGGCGRGEPTALCHQPRGDLWRFAGDDWSEQTLAGGPSPASSAAAAYAPVGGSWWILGGSGVLAAGRARPCTDPADPFLCPPGSRLTERQEGGQWSCECSSTRLWRYDAGSWSGTGGATPAPQAVEEAAVAYHAERAVTVLFGGRTAGERCGAAAGPVCSATWIYDGSLWSQPLELGEPADCSDPTPGGPCPRTGAALATREQDAGTPELILFGGEGAGGMCDGVPGRCSRTWALRWGSSGGWRWSEACSDCIAPLPRSFAAMSGVGGAVYLFGGVGQKSPTGCPFPEGEPFTGVPGGSALDACRMKDLWSFDHRGWTRLGPGPDAPGWPAGRWNFAMVADPLRNQLLTFSGCYEADDGGACPPGSYVSTVLSGSAYDLLEGTWSSVVPLGLAPRFGTSMVRDAARGRVVLFAGENQDGDRFGDVWEWGGAGWSQVRVEGPLPARRSGHGAVYDPAGRRMLVVGGQEDGDVWELDLDPDATPSAVLAFPFGAADAPDATLDKITLAVTAGGTGYQNNPGGAAAQVDGYRVEGWSAATGGWVAWSCAPAPGAPNPDRKHCSPSSPDDYRLGPEEVIYVRVRPQAGAGSGDALASVEIDMAELRVEYSR